MWRQGRDLGLWTETCKFDTGLWGVAYDEGHDLFALSVNSGDPYTVLQQFREPGGPGALLATLKKQGLVLDDDECVMAKVTDQPAPPGWTAWQVVPTGKRKAAFDAVVQTEIPDPPCGKLGYTVDSVGFFMVKDDHPDRVLYANLGQDGTMIDLAFLRDPELPRRWRHGTRRLFRSYRLRSARQRGRSRVKQSSGQARRPWRPHE